ncbi:MAG TPA: hypothetical protein VFF78_02640, partial [Anaerolineaceae bacterium]|nr:hypothetical protein [Anaerolineaceae bacterium]
PFNLGGRPAFVRNYLNQFSLFDVVVDNVSLSSGNTVRPLTPMPWWGKLFGGVAVFFALIGAFLLAAAWFIPDEKTIPYLINAWRELLFRLILAGVYARFLFFLRNRFHLSDGVLFVLNIILMTLIGTFLLHPLGSSYMPGLVVASFSIGLMCFMFSFAFSLGISFQARNPELDIEVRVLYCAFFAALCLIIPSIYLSWSQYLFTNVTGPYVLYVDLFGLIYKVLLAVGL